MITTSIDLEQLQEASRLAKQRLIAERNAEGIWTGRLSSSAVSTAVAAFALAKIAPQDLAQVTLARDWIAEHMNADGGWGDTPQSVSNLSATLLARATLLLDPQPKATLRRALHCSQQWLNLRVGGISPDKIVKGIQDIYGKDLTFAVPILTVCALSGMFGPEDKAWDRIPRLPFELSVFPHQFYRLLNMPVVSYAIPALIAVGIAQFRMAPARNTIMRTVRKACIAPALRKLTQLTPDHGGFLEAAPLTAFVAACLACAGFSDHPVVCKAGLFLRTTMRADGSWPIDTDLSHWLTTWAVKALAGSESLSAQERRKLADRLRAQQFQEVHPFTHAQPGGWGWTFLAGGVPDADDTAGALAALALLEPGRLTPEVISGIEWLLNLNNPDGGVPTFCRGWGLLPFDRSCPDISAHVLEALAYWCPYVPRLLQQKMQKVMGRIIRYLEKSRDADHVWTPLWFGDQHAPRQTNRVYGTATVLTALSNLPDRQVRHLVEPALQWLKKVRNPDGGWGGEPDTPSVFETTAQAVAALACYAGDMQAWASSIDYVAASLIRYEGLPPAAPIGFYFASLWYEEKLYPLLFGLRALNKIKKRNT